MTEINPELIPAPSVRLPVVSSTVGADDPGASEESSESSRLREILIKIGRKSVELTSDPQTDIDPSLLFKWKHKPDGKLDDEATWKQIKDPLLPHGVTINRAVRVARSDLGHTNFIILKDGNGGVVCVKMNEGRTDALRSFAEKENVPEDHREITVVSIRKSEIRTVGFLGIGRKASLYHMDRMVIGSTPEAIRVESKQFTDPKRYQNLMEIFPYSIALSDLPVMALGKDEVSVQPTEERYAAILRIMEQGYIDPRDMTRAIARKRMMGTILTESEYQEKAEYHANERIRWSEAQKRKEEGQRNVVGSTPKPPMPQIDKQS